MPEHSLNMKRKKCEKGKETLKGNLTQTSALGRKIFEHVPKHTDKRQENKAELLKRRKV